MRGGTKIFFFNVFFDVGLSPHARGNLIVKAAKDPFIRPIPACAGEPQQQWVQSYRLWAYPRMRGGTAGVLMPALVLTGLSPHARGNRHIHCGCNLLHGPIPACAGKPIQAVSSVTSTGAYPRMRGGTQINFAIPYFFKGLSPHARGNRLDQLVNGRFGGPIPACAGEPIEPHEVVIIGWAYPRMRGGTVLGFLLFPRVLGLSPHARGNRSIVGVPEVFYGPIPACAGEPSQSLRGM